MDVASLHSPRNGDLTLAEKTLTPLTDSYTHMTEVERGLRTSKGDPTCKMLGCRS